MSPCAESLRNALDRRVKNRIVRQFTGVRRGFEQLGRREWTLHATRGWRFRRV